ncbi:MAG TPA: response regulator [Myxococcota bacterium]|nr:response regulator [Myxococcota bacterium]
MRPFRVLVVDDESALRLTVAANLELEGLEVVEAASGEEALALAVAQPFDLVLTDVRMPGMSGVELYRRLREARSDVPVVLMTAFALEALIEQAVQEGAFAVLPKPFDVQDVLPVLIRAMRRPLVLVIDDQALLAETAAAALAASGVRAAAVTDAASALRVVGEGNVDVCVVDLVMPDVSGAELVARIRAADPTIACIAMSGHDVPEMMRRVAASGAFTVLQKPVPISALQRVIAAARARPARGQRPG